MSRPLPRVGLTAGPRPESALDLWLAADGSGGYLLLLGTRTVAKLSADVVAVLRGSREPWRIVLEHGQ